jgi:5-hydroxyisourate hydrolase-like protein (transthyretin family)
LSHLVTIRAMTLLQRALMAVPLLLLGATAQLSSNPSPDSTAVLNMLVVRETNGKPVKNAEVVVHLVDKQGRIKQEAMELKTHDDGKADAAGIPFGKVRVQVIARGYRTFGEDYDVTQPKMDITIKLQKPREQFSIYK